MQAARAPAFADACPQLYVPFTVRRFAAARIAWINRRWLAEKGVDIDDPRRMAAIENWLLERCGVAAPGVDDPADLFAGPSQTLHADRYGSPAGAFHGGSGRVGTVGSFNVKGVGRTPLVSRSSDWYHSHGCMWLEEAIREAVLSEVAARCFPCGAVPVIAVIDAGCPIHWRDGSTGARRGLVVRPTFLRLASFMRSVFFGSGGAPDSDQARDAERTEAMWRNTGWGEREFVHSFESTGRQYGYGRVNRLWPGPPFASNLTLDGRLVDFGSFRALPGWSRAQGELRSHAFGSERELIAPAAQALDRLGRRYGVSVSADRLRAAFDRGLDLGYDDALTERREGSITPASFRTIFEQAQRRRTGLTGDDGAANGFEGARSPASLYRETLLADVEALLATPHDDGAIGAFIDGRVALGVDQVKSKDSPGPTGGRRSKASFA